MKVKLKKSNQIGYVVPLPTKKELRPPQGYRYIVLPKPDHKIPYANTGVRRAAPHHVQLVAINNFEDVRKGV